MVRTIVVADDDPQCRRVLVRALTNATTAVQAAADGDAALRLVRGCRADLLVSDLQMPGMNGLQLIATVRTERPDFPCILMTGFPTDDLDDDACGVGALRVLYKPLDPTAIQIAANAVLEEVGRDGVAVSAGVAHPDLRAPQLPGSVHEGPERSIKRQFESWSSDYERIQARLGWEYPTLGQDRAWDVVMDTLLGLLASTEDRVWSPEAGVVMHLARFRARDLIASDRSRHNREAAWSAACAVHSPTPMSHQALLARVILDVLDLLPDDCCRDVFTLWLSGERNSDAFARVLSVGHLPPAERRRIVKREKDRLWKCLERDERIRAVADELRQSVHKRYDLSNFG